MGGRFCVVALPKGEVNVWRFIAAACDGKPFLPLRRIHRHCLFLMDTSAWLSFLPPFFQGLVVAVGTGLALGLEREHRQNTESYRFAGLRTFSLTSLAGYLTGYIAIDAGNPWLWPAATLGVLLLVAVAYWAQSKEHNFGITTEIALFISYLCGSLVAAGHPGEAFGAAVATAVILSLKARFQWFVQQMRPEELTAFLKFFVLMVLALLLLPDAHFGPNNLLHYRSVGWVILLVSSISLAGYLLLKFAGTRYGILGAALIGGLFSSTLVAWVFSARSRELPQLGRLLGAGIVFSSSVMYLRVLFLTGLFAPKTTAQLLLPCVLMFLTSILVVGRANTSALSNAAVPTLPLTNPLDLKNALYFGGLYIAVAFFTYYSRQEAGTLGAFASAALSGIADMDAITISTAQWAESTSNHVLAAQTIVAAALSNTCFKMVLVFLRGRGMARRYAMVGFAATLLIGSAWLVMYHH